MKKLRALLLIVFMATLGLSYSSGCGDGDGATPTQAEINEFVDVFIAAGQGLIQPGVTQCYNTCQDISDDPSAEDAEVDCDEGRGKAKISFEPCDSSGTLSFSIEFDDCYNAEEGITLDGKITVSLTVNTDSTLTIVVNANKFKIGEFSFTGNITTTIPCGSTDLYGNATCSGTLTSGDATCTMAADCSGCTI